MKTHFYTGPSEKTLHVATVDNWTAGYAESLPVQFGGVWYQIVALECVADGAAFVVLTVAQERPAAHMRFCLPADYREHLDRRVLAMREAK